MRVAGGRLRGRELVYPRSGLRPTKAVTRHAVFNILAEQVKGARVLDLFAGAGALGIEALSRGAAGCVFVERSPVVLRFLRRNAAGLDGAEVMAGDVRRVAARLAGREFDLIISDPPYDKGLVQQAVELVTRHRLLAEGGFVVIEHSCNELPQVGRNWVLVREGRYGDSRVSVLRRRE
ncbi:MAG: 16S rRNA (guanine(966)-N(2))-methyltransferase RsmD [candidate division WOR-3 bacterium]